MTAYPITGLIVEIPDTGTQGPTGPQGPAGADGATGPQGPQGIPGAGGGGTLTYQPPVYDITNFGAVSGQDSTVAIQAAFDQLVLDGIRGASIFIPLGNFIISDVLDFRHPGSAGLATFNVLGSSRAGSILEWQGTVEDVPLMRLGGMNTSVFSDFRIQVFPTFPLHTGITCETLTGNVVRSNTFMRLEVTGHSGSPIKKGLVFIDGDSIPLNYPTLTGSGADGNNDNNVIKEFECDHYSVAGISFEMSQSKANYIEAVQLDASGEAQTAAIALMAADPAGPGANSSLDQGKNGIGPYGITCALALGGSQSGNGGSFYLNGGVFHNNLIDIYQSSRNDTVVIAGQVNSEKSQRFLQIGPRGWTTIDMPITVSGVRFSSEVPALDQAGIICIGMPGPTTIRGCTFHSGTLGNKFSIFTNNVDTMLDFSYNTIDYKDSVNFEIFNNPSPRLVRKNNSYADVAGSFAVRVDELP